MRGEGEAGREGERRGSPSSHALAVVRKAKVTAWEGEGGRARACKGHVRARARANEFGRSSDEARRRPLRRRWRCARVTATARGQG